MTVSKSLSRSSSYGNGLSNKSRIDAAKSIDYWKQTSSKRPTTVVITGQSKNCTVCTAPVYPAEQMLVDSFSLHPNCFRCHHCNQLLSLSNNEKVEGRFFCKAHYRMYSSGNDSSRTNPLLANARYSLALSSPIEAHSALGRSISGKKAAYESLVNARTTAHHDRTRSESIHEDRALSQARLVDRPGRLERTKSMVAFPGDFNPKDVPFKKTRNNSSISNSEFPVSKIVQNRLRLYERLDESTDSSPPAPAIVSRSVSNGAPTSVFIPESVPTSRANTFPALSPTYGSFDPSFAAAHRTNLRSRIQSYQEQMKTESDIIAHDSSLGMAPGDPEYDEDGKAPGKLTCTFKGVVDALISHGRQNNTEIGVRENLVRHKTVRLSRPAPISPSMLPAAPIHLPTTVHAEGEVSYRRPVLDLDLKVILEQVLTFSPPVAIRDSIQEAVFSVDQRLADKDAYIEKLHQRINELESREPVA